LLVALLAPATAMAAIPRRIHVVVNPFGGGGAGLAALDAVLPVFEDAGIEVTTLRTDFAGHAGQFARELPLLDAFVGIGGDGTAHEIANGMLRRDEAERVPVGIIPAGSGNTWAYDLGLDDAVAAARRIAGGETMCVDVMAVGPVDGSGAVDEFAINICGYGMPAAVLEKANALRWLGSAQYELAGLVLIADGQTKFDATLEIEREDGLVVSRQLEACSFVQGQINMHMGKRVAFAPGARMDDGLLDLVLVKKGSGLDILHANAAARGATHIDLPYVEVVRCKSYTLQPAQGAAEALNLDGELAARAPFRATCVPGALEVFAGELRVEPRDTSAEAEPQLVMGLVRMCQALGYYETGP